MQGGGVQSTSLVPALTLCERHFQMIAVYVVTEQFVVNAVILLLLLAIIMLHYVVFSIGNIILTYGVLLLVHLHAYMIVSWFVLCCCFIVHCC